MKRIMSFGTGPDDAYSNKSLTRHRLFNAVKNSKFIDPDEEERKAAEALKYLETLDNMIELKKRDNPKKSGISELSGLFEGRDLRNFGNHC